MEMKEDRKICQMLLRVIIGVLVCALFSFKPLNLIDIKVLNKSLNDVYKIKKKKPNEK